VLSPNTTNPAWSSETVADISPVSSEMTMVHPRPQLSGQIRLVTLEYTHTRISKRVERIQGAYEKISDAQEQKIAIVHELTWIPGKHEYSDGNENAEEFSDTVE